MRRGRQTIGRNSLNPSRILLLFWLSALVTALSAFSCVADDNVCGPPPVFNSTQRLDESVKGELRGEAQILSRLVGNTGFSGQVEAARTTIYQTSDQAFAAQKDAYLNYMFCMTLMPDRTLTAQQKIEAIKEFRRPLPARSGSSGIYTAPGAATLNTTLDNSQITGCHTGIENYGVQDNFYMKNSTIGCAPDPGSPLVSPAAPTSTAPNPDPPNPGSSGIYNAPGVTTFDTAIINSTVQGCPSGFRFETNRNESLMDNVHIDCGQNSGTSLRGPVAGQSVPVESSTVNTAPRGVLYPSRNALNTTPHGCRHGLPFQAGVMINVTIDCR